MQFRKWTRRNGLTTIGTVLCLLAAIFFVEAKVGWYSPDSTARVELSSTKVRADDASKLTEGAPSAPSPDASPLLQSIPIGAFVFLSAILLSRLVVRVSAEEMVVAASPSAFPPLYLRPPPRR